MNIKIISLILGMAAVTYISRVIPAVLAEKMKFSGSLEKFLKLIPYTAMSALVFPGVFLVDKARFEIGIIGGIVAAILAWRKMPVMVCVLAAIFVDMLIYLI